MKAGCCHCQEVRSRTCRSFSLAPAPYPPKMIIWPPMKTAAAPKRGVGGIPSVVGRCHVHVATSKKCTSFRRFLSAPRPPNTTSLNAMEITSCLAAAMRCLFPQDSIDVAEAADTNLIHSCR